MVNFPIIDCIDYKGENQQHLISSLIDSLIFIPLRGSVECPIVHVNDLQIHKLGFYILDQVRKMIHVYSLDGDLKYEIKAQGQGPEEYLEIACFTVSDSSIFVVDNYRMKIMEFHAADGKFKRTYKSPIVVGGIRTLENGNILLCEQPVVGVRETDESTGNRFYVVDRNFKIVQSMCPFDSRDRFMMPQLITGDRNVFTYASYGFNGFTLLSPQDGHILGNVAVLTQRPFISEDIENMELREAFNYVKQHNMQFISSTPLNTERYTVINIKDGDAANICIYDKRSHILYFNSEDKYYNLLISPDGVYQNKLFTVYNFGEDVLDTQLEAGFNHPSHETDSIIRNEGAAILCYVLK